MSDKLKDSRKIGFFWFDNRFVDDEHIAIMGTDAYAIYSVITRYAGNKTEAFPSLNTLCKKTGLSKNTVIRRLETLFRLKYLQKIEEGCSKTHKSNVYELLHIDFESQGHQVMEDLKASASQKLGASSSGEPAYDDELVHPVNQPSASGEPGLVSEMNTINKHKKRNREEGEEKAPPSPSFSFGEGNEEVEEFINLWNTYFVGRSEEIYRVNAHTNKTVSQFIEDEPEWVDYLEDAIHGYLESDYASKGKDWSYTLDKDGMLRRLANEYRAKQLKASEPPDELGLTLADYDVAESVVKTWIKTGKASNIPNAVVSPAVALAIKNGYDVKGKGESFVIKSKFYESSFNLFNVLGVDAKDDFNFFLSQNNKAKTEYERLEQAQSIAFSEEENKNAILVAEKYNLKPFADQILSPKFVYFLKLHVKGLVKLQLGTFESGRPKLYCIDPLNPKDELVVWPYCFEDDTPNIKKEILTYMEHFETCPHLLTKS